MGAKYAGTKVPLLAKYCKKITKNTVSLESCIAFIETRYFNNMNEFVGMQGKFTMYARSSKQTSLSGSAKIRNAFPSKFAENIL